MTRSHIQQQVLEEPFISKDSFKEEENPKDPTLLPHRASQSQDTQLSCFTLPNELKVFHQTAAQTNIIYAEVFQAKVYLQHGIKLPKQACVFDVGAHIGLFSLFVHYLQSDSRIFAFEPGLTSYQALRKNLSLHKVQATPLNYGLSSTSTLMPFVFFPYMSGMSGLFADPEKDKEAFKAGIRHWMQADEHESTLACDLDKLVETFFAQSSRQICQLKTLSDAIRENNVEHIDLLKIDVEGNEFEILKGIEEQDWPKIEQVVAEIHNSSLLKQVTEHLAEKGYHVTIEIEEGAVLERFEKEGGYRLYMVYASRDKQTISEKIVTVNAHRHHISSQELVHLLRADLDQYL